MSIFLIQIQLLGVSLAKYQRKIYYQALKFNTSHFDIFIYKRVMMILVKLLKSMFFRCI